MNSLHSRDGIFKRDDHGILMSSRGEQAMVISVVFTGLATCFVAMRMFTRVRIMRRVEANDWMVIIALVSRVVVIEEWQILKQIHR
jgi:hypothetical protein